jgi:hypothetical protein
MRDVACFLSMAAGRNQGIDHIYVTTPERIDNTQQALGIYPSFRWRVSDSSEQRRPHPADVPLDPIHHLAEFNSVLVNWIGRHSRWRIARVRYLECMRKANKYSPERLVAAANMFDILPEDAVPIATELPDDFAATRDACAAMFLKYRVSIVESRLSSGFPDLQFVASIAVKCRNFFVHGSSDDFDYPKVEPLIPFLTDALEFIFAASDFADAGWDAQRWNSKGHGWGHNFARFRSEYSIALAELRRAISK